MSIFTIRANTRAVLSNNESVVYGGKNGFVTELGAIPTLCTSVTSNVGSIVFTLDNVHQLVDDNSMLHILNIATTDTRFVKVPFRQYPGSTKLKGSISYYDNFSNTSLPITSFNLTANTITVTNQPYDGSTIASVLPSTPFYVTLFQPISNNFSNRTAFISGSFVSKRRSDNVQGLDALYNMQLPLTPIDRKYIELYLDGNVSNNFIWSGGNTINFPVSGGSVTEARVVVNHYTVPAIERGDVTTLSTFNNNYSIINTSYQLSDAKYDSELTTNKYYKVKLNKDLSSNTSGQALINITPDFEGKISNVTANSFAVSIDPRDYPYTYELANTKVYYMYQKDKLQLTTAKVDEFGKLNSLSPQTYVIEATNINRYNRAIGPVKKLLTIDPLEIAKVASSSVSEQIFIDTTGGASIIANISFLPVKNRDVESYRLRWRLLSSDSSVSPSYTDVILDHDETADSIVYTTPPLNRGRTPGSNILNYEITPKINNSLGFPLNASHPLIGKQTTPAGVKNLNLAQQDNFLIFTWDILQTADGYVFDIDAKEVEIRRYPGSINTSNEDEIDIAWGLSTIVDRIPFPSTTYNAPITVFGTYTYLLRVRDTSDIESNDIAASVISISRPTNIKVYKSYNEREPGVSYITQDGVAFPTSNINPEAYFSSFSESINGGLILADSSNADNSNGSATGFSVYNATDNLSTGSSSVAEYITQIRDMGKVVKGTVRSSPILSIDNPGVAYAAFYETVVDGGISDASSNITVLVDSAFGGIGHVLGFSNALAAPVSFNSFQRTLTSGGPLGNVYAIRNPGIGAGDTANANSYVLIANVINSTSVLLGDAYGANGVKSTSWDLDYANYVQGFNVSSQDVAPNGVFFKPDGTKMYVLGSGSARINEYNLSTAWNISSASFLQFFSVSTQDSTPNGIFFKPDGTAFYITGLANKLVYEYSVSTPWDISTSTYVRSFLPTIRDSITDLFFKPDGTKMYILHTFPDVLVIEYNLGTAWNISTASYLQNFTFIDELVPLGLSFKSDGSRMYVLGSFGDAIQEYTLSTFWDISTATYSREFRVDIATAETGPNGLYFKPDGTDFYITGPIRDNVSQFSLSSVSADSVYANLTVSGNSYQLINLTQFGDEGANRTFLGPSRSILQNLFFRYSTSNVFYDAASNGISGYPNHGNTNPFAFDGAASNAELGWKPYIAGEIDFRYLQLKLQLINSSPTQFSILLQDFNYEVDLKEKSFRKSTISVNSVDGIVIDYSFVNFVQVPIVTATSISSTSSINAVVSNVSESYCNVQLFDSSGTPISYGFVNITASGV